MNRVTLTIIKPVPFPFGQQAGETQMESGALESPEPNSPSEAYKTGTMA
jgi:hypothetical protein